MLSEKGTVVTDPARGMDRACASGLAGRGAKVMPQAVAVRRAGRGRNATGARRVRPCGFRLALARSILAAALASLLPLYGAAAQETAVDAVHDFDLPAGGLAAALDAFGTQSGIEPDYPPGLVAGRQARAVSGRMGWRDALGQLLQGSGLEYRQADDATVVIRRSGNTRSPVAATPAAREEESPTDIQGMTVTGTRIRGGATPSPVITVGAENIQEEGFSDLGDVIRSIPQNFSGGQNPEVPGGNMLGGGLANQNVTGGSALNLRGLGPDASLTLLNGRRMAYGGFWNTVDISAIPVEVVERIEIVADGASAIYGSDAVGGVANVILKRDFGGITLGARYGTATDGGMATREYNVTAGVNWDSGGLIVAYKDVSTDPIYASEREYTDYLPDPRTLVSESDLYNGVLSGYQQVGEVAELRLDLLRSKRQQDTQFIISTLPQYTHVTPETTTTLISPSIEFLLPNDWMLTIGAAGGEDEHRQTQSTVITTTGVSTVSLDDCYCNKTRAYEVGAEGPLFALSGGEARLAIGAGYRKNEFSQMNYLAGTIPIEGDESSRFGYAEINLPLVGAESTVTGVQRLELTAAVRREDYDSFGSVNTPKLGLIYGPSTDFTLKASWGKSFKVPTLFQLNQAQFATLRPAGFYGGTGYPDGATGLLLGGGNPDLQPERARTWTASAAFHPEAVRGLEMGLTWFNIDYTDRVVQPITNSTQALSNPIYDPFIGRYPDSETQSAAIAGANTFVNSTGFAYDPDNVVALIHFEYTNVARQEIRGIDFSGVYRFDLGSGGMTIRGSATYLDSRQQTSPSQDFFDLSGTLFNPAKVSGRVGAVWTHGGVTASAFANYKDSVTNTVSGERPGSFTTFDTALRYSTGERGDAFSRLEFALSAQNLLDRTPPLYTPASLIYSTPYDPTNYSAIGRFLSISVSKNF